MRTRQTAPEPTDDLLAYKVMEIYDGLSDLGRAPGSARAAESAACDLISTVVDHRPDQWRVLLDLLGPRPDPVTCALYTAMSLVLTGQRRVEVARRAVRMRCDLPNLPWIDHIGAAAPTGRAAKERTDRDTPIRLFRELQWLIEMDDGLERYCLMTNQDLDIGSLGWCCFFPDLDTLAAEHHDGQERQVERISVPLAEAVAGMRAAVELPGMFGKSTTVEYLGLWVRWQLSRIDQPVLCNLPMMDLV